MAERRRYYPSDYGEKQWQRLVAFALGRSEAVEFALPYRHVVNDIAAAPLWPEALEAFRDLVVERHVSLIRWDRLQSTPTQFVRFRLSAELRGFVRSISDFEGWSWRLGTPEDPTFYRGAAVILATESGSGRIAVYADTDEAAALSGSGVKLVEPLGVEAEPWPTP